MSTHGEVIAGMDLGDKPRKSRWPARMDVAQSVTGLIIALFMWGHMFFVSSILISKDFMWTITRMFEGYFIFGKPYPGIVSVLVFVIFSLIVLHAFLAMRKFPASFRQWRTFAGHRALLQHSDTTLWWWQVLTGFALFFFASIHLFQMLTHPGAIGPFESAERVWRGWWPLYLVLLFAVEIHGGVGLYRLAVKWNWFAGKDVNATRRNLKKLKWALSVFFIVLGLVTLAAYMKIGYQNRYLPGARYTPAWLTNPPQAAPPAWWPSWLKGEKR